MSTSAGIGGGSTAFDPLEASESANRARVVADAGVTVGYVQCLSAKPEVNVFGESLSRYVSAKSHLICLVRGSKPADHGSDDVALTADFCRAGGADSGLK